ncbi:hypothetical protein Goarm_001280, partial [Gossypium armourianum]|nr:hypothetical protein [Gossypium armourianum]
STASESSLFDHLINIWEFIPGPVPRTCSLYFLVDFKFQSPLYWDSNLVEKNVEYYGFLTDIVELDYYGKRKVVLFLYDWADVNTAREVKKDQFGFTMVNFSQLIHAGQQLIDEPYVFSCQVKQVFYSKDPTNEGWYVVLRNTPRDLFDMDNGNNMPRRRLRDLSIIQNPPNLKETNSDQQTTIGSSNVPNTIDEPVEIQKRVKVSRNSHGQPIGSKARLLAGFLGIIARNVNLLLINYESWHHMPDSNKNQALNNIKELSSSQKVGRLQLFDITHRKKDRTPMTTEADKLKDKWVEYEAMGSSDSSVNLDDIDNQIITEASTVEQIAELKVKAISREAATQRKYDKLQLQLKAEAAVRAAEATRKYDELQL